MCEVGSHCQRDLRGCLNDFMAMYALFDQAMLCQTWLCTTVDVSGFTWICLGERYIQFVSICVTAHSCLQSTAGDGKT